MWPEAKHPMSSADRGRNGDRGMGRGGLQRASDLADLAGFLEKEEGRKQAMTQQWGNTGCISSLFCLSPHMYLLTYKSS